MTIEELEKKLTELDDLRVEMNKQIAELKARGEEKPKPPHLRPYLEDDQNYFFINARGKIENSKWMSDRFDLGAREIGNIFMGETAAEYAAERLKVLAEMREWAGKWNDTFVLTYIGNDDFVQISSVLMSRNTFGEMRFATKEDAEGCIKAVGKERLLRYYFMVPEEDDNGID